MTIIHVTEAGGGVIEFIKYIIHFDTHNKHIVYSGKRGLDSLKSIEEFNRPNVEVVEWKSVQREIHPIKDFCAYLELNRFLKSIADENYTIHLHSSKAGVLGRLWGFFNPNRRLIYTPNGIAYSRKDISFAAKLLYQSIEFVASKLSGRTVCVSNSEKELYAKVDKGAVYINNGIIIDKSVIKNVQKNNDSFTIITTGRLTQQKNPAMFNRIAEQFITTNIRFVWIGDGELCGIIKSPNIRVTGWLAKSQVYQELSNADLYLSTALWEGLPFAVLEAMNHRLPLLLYRAIGNVDLVDENTNGYLFTEVEQVCRLIESYYHDKETLLRMGEASYNYLCSDFDAEKMANNYYKEYCR